MEGTKEVKEKKRIVVMGVDESKIAEHAFDWYIENIHQPDNELMIVFVVEIHAPSAYPAWDLSADILSHPENYQSDVETVKAEALSKAEDRSTITSVGMFMQAEMYQAEVERSKARALALSEVYNTKMNAKGVRGQFVTLPGRAGEVLVSVAQHHGAALVVCGTRGQGTLRRTVLGSVSDYVIHHAHCPVVTVRKQ